MNCGTGGSRMTDVLSMSIMPESAKMRFSGNVMIHLC